MKLMKTLGLAIMLAASSVSYAQQAAAPAAKQVVVTNGMVKAVSDMLKAMQVEKMMRTIASTSRYANAEQQKTVIGKLENVPHEQIYARLAYPLAKVISVETANEMTKFYNSSYGKKIVYDMYNSRGGVAFGETSGPKPTAAERKALQDPAYLKAKKEFDAAQPAIQSEAFKLLQWISKK